MLEWIPIAIASYLSLSFVDITSKIIRTKYFKTSAGLMSLLLIGQSIPVFAIPLVGNWNLEITTMLLSFFVGAFTAIPYLLYSSSLQREEVSRVSALWQALPIFVLILAYVFLGERLPELFYLSFIFLVIGSLLVSAKDLKNITKPDIVFWMMISASLMWASQLVFMKFLYMSNDLLAVFIVMCSGRLVAGVLTALFIDGKNFSTDLFSTDKKLLIIFFLANVFGVSLYHYAISMGSVTMVEAISGFQAFFTLFLAVTLSKTIPSLIDEVTELKAVAHKLVAITLMFIGLALLYI